MYLAHRDRVVRLGDAPAEMMVSFSEAYHLKIDTLAPTNAVRGLSETAESTENVSLFLDTGEGTTPQRLNVQYGYFARTQAAAVVVVPLVLLLLGYSVGPLVGRASVVLVQRFTGHFHVSAGDGAPREKLSGVVLSHETLARIRPGETTYDEVCGSAGPTPKSRSASRPLTGGPSSTTDVASVRRRASWSAGSPRCDTSNLERQEVTIEFEGDLVRDVQADIRRSRVPPGEPT